MSDPTPAAQPKRHVDRTRTGVVTSDKRAKTRTVTIERQLKHPKYGKYLKKNSIVHVHDPLDASSLGDRVEIANCRPISKTKSWRLVRILEKAQTS